MKRVKGPHRPHVFVDDPEMRDPRTRRQFCLCGLPAENVVHQLPDRSVEQDEHRRRVGESEGA